MNMGQPIGNLSPVTSASSPQAQSAIDALICGYRTRNTELFDLLSRIDSLLSRLTGEARAEESAKSSPPPNGYLGQLRECVEGHNGLLDVLRSQLQRLEQIA